MVTHAITVRGSELGLLLADAIKWIENRNFSLGDGELIAIAVGQKDATPDEVAKLQEMMPPDAPPIMSDTALLGHIIGVVRISHTLQSEQCTTLPWADTRWKKCNVISEAARLSTPIPASGKLGKWKLPDDVKEMLSQQLDGLVYIPTLASQHLQ